MSVKINRTKDNITVDVSAKKRSLLTRVVTGLTIYFIFFIFISILWDDSKINKEFGLYMLILIDFFLLLAISYVVILSIYTLTYKKTIILNPERKTIQTHKKLLNVTNESKIFLTEENNKNFHIFQLYFIDKNNKEPLFNVSNKKFLPLQNFFDNSWLLDVCKLIHEIMKISIEDHTGIEKIPINFNSSKTYELQTDLKGQKYSKNLENLTSFENIRVENQNSTCIITTESKERKTMVFISVFTVAVGLGLISVFSLALELGGSSIETSMKIVYISIIVILPVRSYQLLNLYKTSKQVVLTKRKIILKMKQLLKTSKFFEIESNRLKYIQLREFRLKYYITFITQNLRLEYPSALEKSLALELKSFIEQYLIIHLNKDS